MSNKKIILNRYKKMALFLSSVLGQDYEIVLQDVSYKDAGIIAIENNHISGRTIGAPLTDFALQIIKEKTYLNNDFLVNYHGKSKLNPNIKSSTFFIKDNELLIGLLCINFDCSRYIDISKNILSLITSDYNDISTLPLANKAIPYTENLSDSISEIINLSAGMDLTHNAFKLSSVDNLKIVKDLDTKGIFQLKGSIPEVANSLKISEATLYRYLSKINND